jgi:hypothetical protein
VAAVVNALGKVTGLDASSGGLFVELDTQPGFSVGPLPAVAADRAYRVRDRVAVIDLGTDDYAVVGRILP